MNSFYKKDPAILIIGTAVLVILYEYARSKKKLPRLQNTFERQEFVPGTNEDVWHAVMERMANIQAKLKSFEDTLEKAHAEEEERRVGQVYRFWREKGDTDDGTVTTQVGVVLRELSTLARDVRNIGLSPTSQPYVGQMLNGKVMELTKRCEQLWEFIQHARQVGGRR